MAGPSRDRTPVSHVEGRSDNHSANMASLQQPVNNAYFFDSVNILFIQYSVPCVTVAEDKLKVIQIRKQIFKN